MLLRFNSILPRVAFFAVMGAVLLGACVARVNDEEVLVSQTTLLEFAREVVDAVPAHGGYEKDRARLQELVVGCEVELHQLERAELVAAEIGNWRRGSAYADIAIAYARAGNRASMERVAQLALQATSSALEWQAQRVSVKVAQANAILGLDAEAAKLEAGVGEPEQGKVALMRAGRLDAAAFDAQMKTLDEWVATKNFDLVRNASAIYVELFRSSMGNQARCQRIEVGITTANAALPLDIRIGNLLALAQIAGEQRDAAAASARIDASMALIAAAKWLPGDEIEQRVRIATACAAIGIPARALAEATAALTLYDAKRIEIVDIDRATALRSIASAFMMCERPLDAHACFARALDEGGVNPNARPRAEDLAQTCLALARCAMVPTDAMWVKLHAARASLAAPW